MRVASWMLPDCSGCHRLEAPLCPPTWQMPWSPPSMRGKTVAKTCRDMNHESGFILVSPAYLYIPWWSKIGTYWIPRLHLPEENGKDYTILYIHCSRNKILAHLGFLAAPRLPGSCSRGIHSCRTNVVPCAADGCRVPTGCLQIARSKSTPEA